MILSGDYIEGFDVFKLIICRKYDIKYNLNLKEMSFRIYLDYVFL